MEKLGTLDIAAVKRAVKFASKDKGRGIITAVHLDESGDVVATDSFRLYVEHGAWDGCSLDLGQDTARLIARRKGKAEIWRDGSKLLVKAGDEFEGSVIEGTYANYKKILNELHVKTVAYVGKQAKPILDEHKRQKQRVRIRVVNRDLHISGMGTPEPSLKVEKACDGADAEIGFDPAYLSSALSTVGWNARVCIMSATKPAIVWPLDSQSIEIVVMPVRLGTEKGEGMKKAPKSPEPKIEGNEPLNLKGERVCITGTLQGMTRSEAFTRLKLAGGIPSESFTKKTTVLVIAANSGRDKRQKAEKAIENGQKVRIASGTEFLEALKSSRKEGFAEAFARKCKEETGIDMEVRPVPGGGYTARVKGANVEDLTKRIAELEEELRKAKQPTVAEKPKPEKPKAPKPPKQAEAAIEISLEFMREWCEGKNVVATQKREGCCIWVKGDSKPYQEELKDMGFRWAKHKGWYFDPKRA